MKKAKIILDFKEGILKCGKHCEKFINFQVEKSTSETKEIENNKVENDSSAYENKKVEKRCNITTN